MRGGYGYALIRRNNVQLRHGEAIASFWSFSKGLSAVDEGEKGRHAMTFWIVVTMLVLTVSAMLALVLLRGRVGSEPAASYDLRVYRDQLREVDRDVARGIVAAGEADRVRTEISRRILAADAQVQAEVSGGGQSRPISLAVAGLLVTALVTGSLALYLMLGVPGYGDLSLSHRKEMAEQAREGRPSQQVAEETLPPQPPLQTLEAEYLDLIEQLRQTVAKRPEDLQGQVLLAQYEARVGDYQAAYHAQQQVLRLKSDAATADDHFNLADMMILAAGGYVSPEAEEAINKTFQLDPRHGAARYYWGLMMSQTGRPDVTFRIWEQLLRDGPAEAPWIAPIRAQIDDMAYLAGVEFDLPAEAKPLRGPSAGDVAAAGEMNETDRMEMIQGMVAQLSDRLATEGGSPAEWARLIVALGVLDRTDQAQAIYDNALEVFAGNAAGLDAVAAAARQVGILQ
ncbi:MAG: cytochrome c-type biogenesis protein CcmH [Paracoccaceae bacterium]|jgi:cytochrome c-type biogenesis protein CcmH